MNSNENSNSTPTATTPEQHKPESTYHSKIGTIWVSLAAFCAIAILLLIFILQNDQSISIEYFGWQATLSFGVAMILSAIAGSVLTLLIGTVRIIQLKRSGR